MATETKDSPQIANLKFRLAELKKKAARIAEVKSTPDHDMDAARARTARFITETETELKLAQSS